MDTNEEVKRLQWMDRLCEIMQSCGSSWSNPGVVSAGLATVVVAYSDLGDTGEGIEKISFSPCDNAVNHVKTMCLDGSVGNYLFDVPPGTCLNGVPTSVLPLRTIVERAFLEVMPAFEADACIEMRGGSGECTLAIDGSAHLAHSLFESSGHDPDSARKFWRLPDGEVHEDEDALLQIPNADPADLTDALVDALTALRDLSAGYPDKELHRPVEEILEQGREVLRKAGVQFDLEAKSDMPAPGAG